MKTYFTLIKYTQEILLAISVILLATLPTALATMPEWFGESAYLWLYGIAHTSLFLVMLVRPLADILTDMKWLRPLVILRKGVGVLSASIIVSFILVKIITEGGAYFLDLITPAYWSLYNLALFAHLADISAVLLLVTSNNASKRLLGKNWKRIQRLSYVYFYGSGLYVFFILGETLVLVYLTIITVVTVIAYFLNRKVALTRTHQTNI